jgi:thiamine phosphate synthase YjbQ (UPF0047 family)
MPVRQTTLSIRTKGQGAFEITAELMSELKRSQLKQGVLTVFASIRAAAWS